MIEDGKKIRIVMHRAFPDEPPTIFRGDVERSTETLLEILGRRYTKIFDSASNRAEEKPLDTTDKSYVIPLSSFRFIEIIREGSTEEELDEKIRSEQIIYRKGGFAVID